MPETHSGNGHSQDLPEVPLELRALMSEIKTLETTAVGLMSSRTSWARSHGMSFDNSRDEYQIFGYPDIITTQQYRDAYERGGLMGSVVDVMPDATWRGEPAMELVEDEDPEHDTEFEKAWKAIEKKHQINAKFRRIDKLSRLSSFGVLLIGAGKGADADLTKELPKARGPEDLLYLKPFLGGGGPGGNRSRAAAINASSGAEASIHEYETDSASERFGLPKTYMLRYPNVVSADFSRPVHWTRVHHVAEGLLDDDVFGQPALQRVWNLFIDLRKVSGGGAEAFFLRANAGTHIDIDPEALGGLTPEERTAAVTEMQRQAELYKHQLTRWIQTRGVKIEQLGSDVANFAQPADAVITQIAGTMRIPKRILTGAEMGELASSQDRENFRDQIIGRQMQYAGPYIVRPLIDRLIEYGYLPKPQKAEGYVVKWPHIQVLTETEKTAGAASWAATNQAFGETVFTDAEIRDKWAGLAPLTDEQRQEIADRAAEKVKQAQALMPKTAPPEDEGKFEAAAEHKFSSTQVQLPPAIAEALLAFGKSIPDFDLCEEEGGREDDAHITVKYGLHTNDAADVRKVLATYVGPIRITLGKTAIFTGKNYDVLYVEVSSPDLVALNRRLSDSLEVTDTHPVYTPHATVAYLKQGLGVRYVGLSKLEGMSASIGSVRFSSAEGEDVDLRITGRAPEGKFSVVDTRMAQASDVEMLRVLTAAIETGATDVVHRLIGLGGDMQLPDLEVVAEAVHVAWVKKKKSEGVTTRKSADGEELMVPYADLSDEAKELDRVTVRAVYAAIKEAVE